MPRIQPSLGSNPGLVNARALNQLPHQEPSNKLLWVAGTFFILNEILAGNCKENGVRVNVHPP